MSLDKFAAAHLSLLEEYLDSMVRPAGEALSPFYGMMQYHLGWVDAALRPARSHPGKRLRPLLCLLACRAAGGVPADALPAACALELVHSFSLVHDDIQDGSRMRRGRPAVWDVWGQPQALNVGDGLFALARLAILRLPERGISPERTLAAAVALDRACLELCEGQFLDMSFEKRADVSLEEYLAMIGLKTAALLAASARIGAIVATDAEGTIAALGQFGERLGLAFQIQDDVLGLWGEESVTGKPASTDLRDKKKTLPVLYALRGGPADSARLRALLGRCGPLEGEELAEAMTILERSGSREYSEREVRHYVGLALEGLEEVGLGAPGRDGLEELAGTLLGRNR